MPELIIPDIFAFYENHSLVLINNGGASFNEVIESSKSEFKQRYLINLKFN